MKTSRYQFNMLPLMDRVGLVGEYGNLLHSIYIGYYRVDLFVLNSRHLVEVWTRMGTDNVDEVYIPSYKQMDIHCNAINLKVIFNG